MKDSLLPKTKVKGLKQVFDLSQSSDRKKYFKAKVGKEIDLLKKYFKKNTFIAYLLGKKNAGKGTYTKLLIEIFGDKIKHISIGDIVRTIHSDLSDKQKKAELMDYLSRNYRGYISAREAISALMDRNKSKSLIPTEFILALIKREIDRMPKSTLLIDGFPRDLDQVSYSLFFRELINHREDLDIFVTIEIPETIISERMKNRVVCPKCQTPRSLRLLATKKAGYDKEKDEFYLMCDSKECGGARMVAKEYDDLGIESIRGRLDLDGQLINKVLSLHGINKIVLKNAVPVDHARKFIDKYELTPEYSYSLDEKTGKVNISGDNPWIIKDDSGNEVCSLLAPAVVVSWIKQLVNVLGL